MSPPLSENILILCFFNSVSILVALSLSKTGGNRYFLFSSRCIFVYFIRVCDDCQQNGCYTVPSLVWTKHCCLCNFVTDRTDRIYNLSLQAHSPFTLFLLKSLAWFLSLLHSRCVTTELEIFVFYTTSQTLTRVHKFIDMPVIEHTYLKKEH